MSDNDVPDFLKPDHIYGKDAQECERHLLARRTFLALYFENFETDVTGLIEWFVGEFAKQIADETARWEQVGEKLTQKVMAFIRDHGPYFSWFPGDFRARVCNLIMTRVIGSDDNTDCYELKYLPLDIEAFAQKSGESFQEQMVRWKAYSKRVDKKFAQARGRLDKRSESAVQRNVRWYFENKHMGRSVSKLTHEFMRQTHAPSDDNDKLYSEREKVRDGIKEAEHLLNLALPGFLDPTEL